MSAWVRLTKSACPQMPTGSQQQCLPVPFPIHTPSPAHRRDFLNLHRRDPFATYAVHLRTLRAADPAPGQKKAFSQYQPAFFFHQHCPAQHQHHLPFHQRPDFIDDRDASPVIRSLSFLLYRTAAAIKLLWSGNSADLVASWTQAQ